MKKTFPLPLPPEERPRAVEGVKKDVRKYLKRERRKSLPEGVDYWDFDCRIGQGKESPSVKHVAELIESIDAAAAAGVAEIYVEILAKPGIRLKKAPAPENQKAEGDAS